ncbi:hypothetical protein AB0L25_22215 [Spirillospora sp. NPDC052242]
MNATCERPDIRFLISGDVTAHERGAAERAVGEALAKAHGAVTSVQVTLSVVADPALPRPALARAVIEIDGRIVRAQAAAPRLAEAIALLRSRLAVRMTNLRVG